MSCSTPALPLEAAGGWPACGDTLRSRVNHPHEPPRSVSLLVLKGVWCIKASLSGCMSSPWGQVSCPARGDEMWQKVCWVQFRQQTLGEFPTEQESRKQFQSNGTSRQTNKRKTRKEIVGKETQRMADYYGCKFSKCSLKSDFLSLNISLPSQAFSLKIPEYFANAKVT